ncbi:MAG TPA: sigma-70 family RNA polymerase sigma factor [Vitreimonas sp.]|uniref:RNA polymerase sigma factor n=1 Tax=Vitreimonas sp. TaxID=3069702 RepID=UPI002D2EE256|nr:sigma-70 family RNA polymerase sigma factor [Vitreimonas sp.]HYD86614.1 sigma-70 family RNA polymerase sigma factor [Vitreimonas sp.]
MLRGLDQALDEYLVLLAQAGEREAFERLAARWSPRLLAFAARSLGDPETARDAMQETWMSAWRTIDRLDDPAKLRPWLYAIAARKCTDALRQSYRRRRIADALPAPHEPPPPADASDARLDLAAALKRLPPEQRIAVGLFFGEDMSVAEIAAATGVPAGTVKSRLFAARKALRASFGEGQ